MAKRRKDYTPKFKFQLIVETLQHDGSDSEIARVYDVHPVTLSKWKARFFEQGSEIFSGQQQTLPKAHRRSRTPPRTERGRNRVAEKFLAGR